MISKLAKLLFPVILIVNMSYFQCAGASDIAIKYTLRPRAAKGVINIVLSETSHALESAVKAISLFKLKNNDFLNDPSADNPFMTKLQDAAKIIYDEYKLYTLPAKSRLFYCNAVFDRADYLNTYIMVNSLYKRLNIDDGSTGNIITPAGYYYLAKELSEIEQQHHVTDNHNIRFGIGLVFDFWENEKRILEQEYLIEEIDKELSRPGSGNLPLIATMQDIHGGAKRALSLIGFVFGLTDDVNSEINTLEDLKILLMESGIDADNVGVRFIGLNDKYDRGNDPIGVFELVRWLRETGKAKPFIGNHDFWRAMSVLGIQFLFEEEGIDYNSADVKNHHIAYWAQDAFKHSGWGDIELEQINQNRFNLKVKLINVILGKYGLQEMEFISLAGIRAQYENELRQNKKINAKIRTRNELYKNDPGYQKQPEIQLPNILQETSKHLRAKKHEYNFKIDIINKKYNLKLPYIEFDEVSLDNYWRDPDVIERALWELKNFRLFYVDILGNLHMHNILPIDYKRGGFDVEYKGLRSLPALELMAEEVRLFFEDLHTIPDLMAFREQAWAELGEIFTIINSWYSDLDAYSKTVSVKKFIDEGGLEGLGHEILGHITQTFVDRESSFLVIWGHNERKKFTDSLITLPWIYLYPGLNSGIANIDYEMSEGYSNMGAVLTFFKRDSKNMITGMRMWGYKNSSNDIKDVTFEDTAGLNPEQQQMLQTLTDGKKFMKWYKRKALKHIAEEAKRLIEMARNKQRPDKEIFAKIMLEKARQSLEGMREEHILTQHSTKPAYSPIGCRQMYLLINKAA